MANTATIPRRPTPSSLGQEKGGQPLTAAQERALDALDGLLRERDLQVEFGLRPGDLFFANNRSVFRRAFAST